MLPNPSANLIGRPIRHNFFPHLRFVGLLRNRCQVADLVESADSRAYNQRVAKNILLYTVSWNFSSENPAPFESDGSHDLYVEIHNPDGATSPRVHASFVDLRRESESTPQ